MIRTIFAIYHDIISNIHVMIVFVVGEESVHLSLDGLNHSFAKVCFSIILNGIIVYVVFCQEATHLFFHSPPLSVRSSSGVLSILFIFCRACSLFF